MVAENINVLFVALRVSGLASNVKADIGSAFSTVVTLPHFERGHFQAMVSPCEALLFSLWMYM